MAIRVNTAQVDNGIALLTTAIGKGKTIPLSVAKYGSKVAKQIAPEDTRSLKQGIQWVSTGQKGRRVNAKVVSKQPNHPISGTKKPYHLWMHGIGSYDTSTNRYKKGKNPKYMLRAAELMEKRIDTELRKV